MKKLKSICASICLILPLAVLGSPFTNGSFELPGNLPQNSYTNLFENNTLLVGWETRGVTYYVNGLSGGLDFPPVDGSYHLNLTSKPNTSGSLSVISQIFDTVANQDYAVNYFEGKIQGLSLTAQVFSDPLADPVAVFTPKPTAGHGYVRQQFIFTAKSATTTLRFVAANGGYALDGVTVDAVDVLMLAPTNLSQAVSVTKVVGESVAFRPNVVGAQPVSYQWLYNGKNISGETNATLILTRVRQTDAGSYSAIVVNNAGVALSQEAKLVVLPQVPPAITGQPENVAVAKGERAMFRVIATGTPAPTFQWFHSEQSISGATTSTYSIGSAQTADAGSYSVVISNPAGIVRSKTALLTVRPLLTGMKLSILYGFRYAIDGESGRTYTIEVSQDLQRWTSLIDVTNTNAVSVFVDPSAVGLKNRFFRARVK